MNAKNGNNTRTQPSRVPAFGSSKMLRSGTTCRLCRQKSPLSTHSRHKQFAEKQDADQTASAFHSGVPFQVSFHLALGLTSCTTIS